MKKKEFKEHLLCILILTVLFIFPWIIIVTVIEIPNMNLNMIYFSTTFGCLFIYFLIILIFRIRFRLMNKKSKPFHSQKNYDLKNYPFDDILTKK